MVDHDRFYYQNQRPGYSNYYEPGSEVKHFGNPWEELSYVKYLMSEKYKVFENPETMQSRTRSIQYL